MSFCVEEVLEDVLTPPFMSQWTEPEAESLGQQRKFKTRLVVVNIANLKLQT